MTKPKRLTYDETWRVIEAVTTAITIGRHGATIERVGSPDWKLEVRHVQGLLLARDLLPAHLSADMREVLKKWTRESLAEDLGKGWREEWLQVVPLDAEDDDDDEVPK